MSRRLLSRFLTFCSDKFTSPAMRHPPSASPFTSRANPSPDGGSVKKKIINVTSLKNQDLGPFFQKLARDAFTSGDLGLLDNALGFMSGDLGPPDYALGDAKCVVVFAVEDGESNLDLAKSLRSVAALYCNSGKFEEGLSVLERAVKVVDVSAGTEHALAVSLGYMQMGDVYNMMERMDRRIESYKKGVQIQIDALGDKDPRVAQALSYLAKAHVEAQQFNEAGSLCEKTLEIHRVHSPPASLEEAADRQLMAGICEARGDYESALEHLVLASRAMIANGQENEVAAIDVSIGNIYSSLARFDEAVLSFQKALTFFKSSNGDNHHSVASVFVRLADLYYKTGKIRESRSYCENALRIYSKLVPGITSEEIARGMTELSAIYELFNEPEESLKILHKALKLYEDKPGQKYIVARIEANLGAVLYSVGRYKESRSFFDSAVTKLRAVGESKYALFGIVLNRMGLACGMLRKVAEAVELFEEAREILERECGPSHPNTLGINSNLALIYDNLGRLDCMIEILEEVLNLRKEKRGTTDNLIDLDDDETIVPKLLLKQAERSSIDDATEIREYVRKLRDDDNEKKRLTDILRDAGLKI